MKFIDLSITLENGLPSDPPFNRATIRYETHADTVPVFRKLLDLDPEDNNIPDEFYSNEYFQASSHAYTHVDAPWHYSSVMNGNEKAWSIDEVPLEWCYGPGVVLDFSDKPSGYVVTAEDVENAFKKINYEMREGTIVLIRSGAEYAWNTEDYFDSGCGLGAEATKWLCEHGMRLGGTDAWGWDIPFKYQAERFAQDHDVSKVWDGHLYGINHAYCHIEKLFNLKSLPSSGFTVCAFPCKLKGASAGWSRVVAMIDE